MKQVLSFEFRKFRIFGILNFHRLYCNKTDFRGREKKYNEVKNRTEKIQKGFEVLELDLEEIQGKVDQYLAWLKKKEEQVQLTQPQGYSVKDAEAKVQYLNVSTGEIQDYMSDSFV